MPTASRAEITKQATGSMPAASRPKEITKQATGSSDSSGPFLQPEVSPPERLAYPYLALPCPSPASNTQIPHKTVQP